jgi:lysylphosphatidylglycerol synthetase-like protein (DUF2156 family)
MPRVIQADLDEVLDKHIPFYIKVLRDIAADKVVTEDGVSKNEVTFIVAAVALYGSSKRLERLTKQIASLNRVLIIIIIVLALLTLLDIILRIGVS